MTITLTFGWWLLPAIVTAAVFGFVIWQERKRPSVGGLGDVGGAAITFMGALVAAVVSLAAWLIWSLLT